MDAVDWWAFWIWQTADESFEMKLDDYQNDNLPRTTQEHNRNEPVPLLSPEETAAYEGKLIKICESSPRGAAVRTAAVPAQHQRAELDDHRRRSTLVPRAVEGAPSWSGRSTSCEQSSIVRYQICTRYCDDHGYVNTANEGRDSWIESFDCAGPDH